VDLLAYYTALDAAEAGVRRWATPHRLCTHMAALRATLRNNLCDYQSIRRKVLSFMDSPRTMKKEAK
jgi:hypothetical protein